MRFQSGSALKSLLLVPVVAALSVPCYSQVLEKADPGALALIQARCLTCHDSETKTSGLDLSSREGALAGGVHGPALVPGKPDESLLYQRVAAGEMPLGNPLPQRERDIFRQWIAAGAVWEGRLEAQESRPRAGPDWWSLQPLSEQEPPEPEGMPTEWSRSAIDPFVYSKLAEKGLQPAPPADRVTFIRRATFDLLGLPPTPEDIDAFVNDRSDEAYERLIDRLLSSPHYGERWGRHWLDVVRFGESHAYEQNHLRDNAWPFRDYVIRSFNNDKPFDQMVLEHLAGDQIAAGNPDVAVATGFLVAGPHDTVGIDNIEGQLQQRADGLDDVITATAAGFLGLTVNCARCHDHKFDPIQQADYYRMRAIFEGLWHGERVWAEPHEIQSRLAKERPLQEELALVENEIATLKDAAKDRVDREREVILAGYRPPVDPRGTEETFPSVEARFVRMKILAATGSGVSRLDEIEVWTGGVPSRNVALASAGAKATADSTRQAEDNAAAYSPEYIIDGKFAQRWISATTGPAAVTIELAKSETISRIFWSRDRLGAFQAAFNRGVPTRYVFETSLDGTDWKKVADSSGRLPYSEEEREELVLLKVFSADEKRRWQDLQSKKEDLEQRLAALPEVPKAYLGKFEQPKEPTYLFQRGNPMNKGDVVAPASLSTLADVLPGFELDANAPEGERRLALARWITHDRNPLTSRVLANRVWHYHFGRGLVGTPSDFGFNGERPTHPELLDWLAGRIQTLGWRMKPLHKEIMLSQAYRQSSRYNKRYAEVDSEARLLWRFPPRRLEAESIRDSILAVSGKLDRTMGGPGFRLYRYTVDNVATYYPLEHFGEETYRRGVYHQAARSVRVELLGQYDCPDSSLPAPKRVVTTSPLQALTLMNNSFMVDQSRFFAKRLVEEAGPDAEAQAKRAFRLAFGRAAEPEELSEAVEFIEQQGLAPFCRALLNANEFVYVM